MKYLFILLISILIIPFVTAINLAYVVKNPSDLDSDETAIRDILINRGYSVTILDDISFDASDYNVIIVSESVSDISKVFNHAEHKTLFLSNSAAKREGFSPSLGTTSGKKIQISDIDSIVTGDFSLGELKIYNSQDTIDYLSGCKPINARSLAYKSQSYKSVLLLLDKNSLLLDGSCNKRDKEIEERNLFFGLTEAANWNSDVEQLFLNSIAWLVEGEDFDGDGHYDDDCNDDNPEIWQNLQGYIDNDNDGFGTGSLVEVCSGTSLPQGYSEINGDCDDNNNQINPNINEIPYDGIDNNCDGVDLTDVDEDGYDASEVGGPDCNDNNPNINPGAEELIDNIDQNCENDAPIFLGDIDNNNIPNLTWNEDEAPEPINLNNYFIDPDGDELTYFVHDTSPDKNITVYINDSIVSFSSEQNWYGQDWLIFKAQDPEKEAISNQITLTVLPINDAPILEIGCETEILEDEEYTCNLIVSDLENDEIFFEVISENNLNCDIENSLLYYSSYENQIGEASCLIRVSDNQEHNDFLFQVNIQNINDKPEIISVTPINININLLKGTSQEFSVSVQDIDNDNLVYLWLLDKVQVGNSETYLFNAYGGDHILEIVITDGEFSIGESWNIHVGDTDEFTCEEVNGNICSENEICTGELINVKDTNSCCSTTCSEKPPEFSDINKCETKNENIELNIKKPEENEKFELDKIIGTEIEIKNNFDEKLDFDISLYLYDLTEEEKIEATESSIKLKDKEKQNLNFDIKIPYDINESNEYAIIAVVEDEDNEYCNQEYAEINLNRPDSRVIIEDIEIIDDKLCANQLELEAEIINIGKNDKYVTFYLENQELNINEQTPEFKIEKYNEDDREIKTFSIQLQEPEEKTYELLATLTYDDKKEIVNIPFNFDKSVCNSINNKIQSNSIQATKITINPKFVKTKKSINPKLLLTLTTTLLVAFFIFSYLLTFQNPVKNKIKRRKLRKKFKFNLRGFFNLSN